MLKRTTGLCPVFNHSETISINYIDCSTNEEKLYAKGTYKCEKSFICTLRNACPIHKNAPDTI